ncbi:DNA methyltransferase [Aestuariivirga litoralis]|uniref:DNA methyltransferase n=1 Tax=Aestuariivirga litoralis TaxID=2650924 RepID=UPI0018C5CA27|nr:DNA methyltransferase [Aestuariivirga litoralis]MBG1233977.1 DNA methylase [Aestuariivirga litoralis]
MSRFAKRQRLGAIPAVSALLRNTVLQGDCIQLMKDLPDNTVDFILTDPPYVCHYRDRHGRTVANDDNSDWLAPAFEQAYRVLKHNSFCVSFYGWTAADAFTTAWKAAGFRLAGHLVFAKPYSSSARYLGARHECAYLLTKGRPALPADPLPDVLGWSYTGNKLHPTQKPVDSLKPLINAFSAAGGLVLDPFCGSGSSLVAAKECGRDWLGLELDAAHQATASHRLAGGFSLH